MPHAISIDTINRALNFCTHTIKQPTQKHQSILHFDMNKVVLTGGPRGPLRSDVISDVEAEIISLLCLPSLF